MPKWDNASETFGWGSCAASTPAELAAVHVAQAGGTCLGIEYTWNFTVPAAGEFLVSSMLELIASAGGAVDGVFTDVSGARAETDRARPLASYATRPRLPLSPTPFRTRMASPRSTRASRRC